jgi:hypothetical protein
MLGISSRGPPIIIINLNKGIIWGLEPRGPGNTKFACECQLSQYQRKPRALAERGLPVM